MLNLLRQPFFMFFPPIIFLLPYHCGSGLDYFYVDTTITVVVVLCFFGVQVCVCFLEATTSLNKCYQKAREQFVGRWD